jgi:predicted GIY-YIG superfamily endonuclease
MSSTELIFTTRRMLPDLSKAMTRLDPPLALLRVEVCSTFREARQREAQLKRWSRPKKEALIRGDFESLRVLSRSRDGVE